VIGLIYFEDIDTVNTFKYAVKGKNGAFFNLYYNQHLAAQRKQRTAVLATSVTLDYEFASEYEIIVLIDDGEVQVEVPYIIYVTDVNDCAPEALELTGGNTEIYEGQPAGEVVGQFSYIDQDTVDDGFSVTLTGPDAADFSLDDDNVVRTATSFTYDSSSSNKRKFTISVSDGVHTSSKDFVVTIINVNDHPIQDVRLSAHTVSEDTPIDTEIGTVTWTDLDGEGAVNPTTGVVDEVTVAINTASNPEVPFYVVGDKLFLASELDYESKTSYTVPIIVSDGVHETKTSFTIDVTDVNDNAPKNIQVDSTHIPLFADAGTKVGSVSFKDVDTVGSYSIVLEGMGLLALEATGEKSGDIVTTRMFQLEDLALDVGVTVKVSDGVHTVTEPTNFILYNPFNNPPEGLFLSNDRIEENAGADAVVGIFMFADQDVALDNTTTVFMNPIEAFSVTVSTVELANAFYMGPIETTPNLGSYQATLFAAVDFDYEERTEYNIKIDLVDALYSPQYVLEIEELISIVDMDDNAPTELFLNDETSVVGSESEETNSDSDSDYSSVHYLNTSSVESSS
jgi:hypothetical protein